MADVEHEDIERLVAALNAAMTNFIESDSDDATHLYIDRTKSGEWGAVFLCSQFVALDSEMTRWTTGEDAIHTLALVQSGHAADVAKEIISGWDNDWDGE